MIKTFGGQNLKAQDKKNAFALLFSDSFAIGLSFPVENMQDNDFSGISLGSQKRRNKEMSINIKVLTNWARTK